MIRTAKADTLDDRGGGYGWQWRHQRIQGELETEEEEMWQRGETTGTTEYM